MGGTPSNNNIINNYKSLTFSELFERLDFSTIEINKIIKFSTIFSNILFLRDGRLALGSMFGGIKILNKNFKNENDVDIFINEVQDNSKLIQIEDERIFSYHINLNIIKIFPFNSYQILQIIKFKNPIDSLLICNNQKLIIFTDEFFYVYSEIKLKKKFPQFQLETSIFCDYYQENENRFLIESKEKHLLIIGTKRNIFFFDSNFYERISTIKLHPKTGALSNTFFLMNNKILVFSVNHKSFYDLCFLDIIKKNIIKTVRLDYLIEKHLVINNNFFVLSCVEIGTCNWVIEKWKVNDKGIKIESIKKFLLGVRTKNLFLKDEKQIIAFDKKYIYFLNLFNNNDIFSFKKYQKY